MPHIHEKIDYCVGVYIVHKNRVLIRKHDKYGKWIHVGGHVELDETPIEAAKRECLEEVGLTITLWGEQFVAEMKDDIESRELLPPQHMNIHRVSETHQHIDLIYYATSERDVVTPENPQDEWMWLTLTEVQSHSFLSEKVRHYASSALRTVCV